MFFDSRELNSRYFNPRSHKGSDAGSGSYFPSLSFQSTLPQGERRRIRRRRGKVKNFNPRSHKGSDSSLRTGGRTSRAFQSTLPQGERRRYQYVFIILIRISIHAPTRGATIININGPPFYKFQSTLPQGERRFREIRGHISDHFNPRSHKGSDVLFVHYAHNVEISIHAPTRGATAILHKIPYLFYFIFTNPFPISYFHTQPASDF